MNGSKKYKEVSDTYRGFMDILKKKSDEYDFGNNWPENEIAISLDMIMLKVSNIICGDYKDFKLWGDIVMWAGLAAKSIDRTAYGNDEMMKSIQSVRFACDKNQMRRCFEQVVNETRYEGLFNRRATTYPKIPELATKLKKCRPV